MSDVKKAGDPTSPSGGLGQWLRKWLPQREARFHPAQEPPSWFTDWGGWTTASGASVTPDTALQVTTVYACVRVLAESVASLPLITYQRNGDSKERAFNHPLYPILHDSPNPEMSAYMFWETMIGQVALRGNAYAEIEYNQAGRVMGLWPLNPDRMGLERLDGQIVYVYDLPKPDSLGRSSVALTAAQVFHLRGLSGNGLVGFGPIQLARQAVGLAMATEEHGSRFFGNGARPGGVLEHPGKLGQDAYNRLKTSWEKRHQGLENASRVAILEEGLKYHELGVSPEDAQFLQTRRFQVQEIARLYRIPPHMVGDLERATFSNIEHQSIDFVVHTLRPWLVRTEQEILLKLFMPAERRRYYAEFLVDGLLRGDTQSRYNAYAIGRQWGWLSANDVRRIENMNPVDDGDLYLSPLNMIPAGEASQMPESTPDAMRAALPLIEARRAEQEQRSTKAAQNRHRLMKSYRRVYQDTATRILNREKNDLLAAGRRMLGSRDLQSFAVWLDEFYVQHADFITRYMRPVAQAYGEMVVSEAAQEINTAMDMENRPELEKFATGYLSSYAARHSGISKYRALKAVQDALAANEDPYQGLEEELNDWPTQRADEISLAESVRYNNAMSKAVYTLAGVMYLRSVAFGNSCPYCSSLNGVVVGIHEWFLEAGNDFKPEGADRPLTTSENKGHAPYHDGCDCMIVASL